MPARRVLLMLGLVLLCLAGVDVVLALEGSSRQALYANVVYAVEIAVSPVYEWKELKVGANESDPQIVTVRSNAPYSLKLRSVTRTRMAEYDLSQEEFVKEGRSLVEGLQWRLDGEEGMPQKISRSDLVVLTGQEPTGNQGRSHRITFVQEVGYSDERLPEGRLYRIDVVYSVSQEI